MHTSLLEDTKITKWKHTLHGQVCYLHILRAGKNHITLSQSCFRALSTAQYNVLCTVKTKWCKTESTNSTDLQWVIWVDQRRDCTCHTGADGIIWPCSMSSCFPHCGTMLYWDYTETTAVLPECMLAEFPSVSTQ